MTLNANVSAWNYHQKPCRRSSADYLDPLASTDQDFLEEVQAV